MPSPVNKRRRPVHLALRPPPWPAPCPPPQLFTNTAAALPCERPGARTAAASPASLSGASLAAQAQAAQWAFVSKGEARYQRRVAAQRAWAARQ